MQQSYFLLRNGGREEPAIDIIELRRQHEDIAHTAALLAGAIDEAECPPGVGAIRWQFARKLMTHLALEDSILYPALMRSPDNDVRATATALRSETGILAETFKRYMAGWSDERIARQWGEFCAETGQILAVLQNRIEQENNSLYPLAEAIRAQPDRGRMAT